VTFSSFGWTADRQAELDAIEIEGGRPARVSAAHRGAWDVWTRDGPRRVTLAGSLHHAGEAPAVGDWVVLDGDARIAALLPRRSALARKAAGRTAREQVIAANLDTVFVVGAVGADHNPRRVERYVTAVWDSGAFPVVLLNKADLGGDVSGALAQLELAAPGVEVHPVSARTGAGLEALAPHLVEGATVALVGSSGVGKSSLVNALSDLELATAGLGVDDRGQHTTTARQMFRLASGALIIDTPGMRELGLLGSGDGLEAAFADVESFAGACRFRDCQHLQEPGCAVLDAVERGALSEDRLDSYQKLRRELAHHGARLEGWERAEENRKQRVWTKSCKARQRLKKR